jgi:transcriptional regulator of acetoin/glycerol metabolism
VTAGLELPRQGLEFGRELPRGLFEADDRVSRMHARVERRDGAFTLEDLGSRNGTFLNGERVTEKVPLKPGGLIRIGRSLMWLVEDVSPFVRPKIERDEGGGPFVGARLTRAFAELAQASKGGDPICLRGESGAGKELAARAFHAAKFGTQSTRPFVAVNCAAIPEGLAERLLFGARRGAYSGATHDAEGYVQAADGGTLFLDEIADLDPLVQAKLLRVLETREVLQLGASKPRAVDIQVCVASHKSLREEVTQGRFREDLYFRVGRPEVFVPPLRERLDEIPWLVQRELRTIAPDLSASVNFIESCALRHWPGNVREFLREVRRAARQACDGATDVVEVQHLADDAGHGFEVPPPSASERPRAKMPSDEQIESALTENGGNVRGTARALGMHRNQLRRWLDKRAGRPPAVDARGSGREQNNVDARGSGREQNEARPAAAELAGQRSGMELHSMDDEA